MKKLILSAVVTLFLTSAFAIEIDKPTEDTPTSLNATYSELTELLNDYPSISKMEENVVVRVRIGIKENNEIVVIGTNAVNSDLDTYIKDTLNNKKLASEELAAGRGLVFLVKFAK